MLRRKTTVCRVGGDEFLILLPDMVLSGDADHMAEKALQGLPTPFAVGGPDASVSIGLGVSVHPTYGEGVDTAIKNPDIHPCHAREEGWDSHRRYTSLQDHETPVLGSATR